jgi:hypothetical protein
MQDFLTNLARGNRNYQRELASALVASLGHEAAVEICRGNGWQGALGVLLATRPGDDS